MSEASSLEKFFMMVFGNPLHSNVHFMDQLKTRLQLHEVTSLDKSDVIIAFIVIKSRVGTDIEDALHKIPQVSQPVVLVVLHHTYDKCYVAPDSRLIVNRHDLFTVDCLFHEDQGLLRCQLNNEALTAVTDDLISKGGMPKSQRPLHTLVNIPRTPAEIIQCCSSKTREMTMFCIISEILLGACIGKLIGISVGWLQLFLGAVTGGAIGYLLHFHLSQGDPTSAESGTMKFFMVVCGNTVNCHVNFMDRLKARLTLQEVSSADQSNIIIAFVVITSRAGTDIEAALEKIPQLNRPVVLVVLHHTFEHNYIAPDSRLIVNTTDVFTVDCLFHEDQGLLRSLKNDQALKAVTEHLFSKRGMPVSEENFTLGVPAHTPAGHTQCCARRTRMLWIIFGILSGGCTGKIFGISGGFLQLLLGAVIGAGTGYLLHFHN